MEATKQSNCSIFQTLNKTGKKLQDSKLSEEVLKELHPEIQVIAEYLKVDNRQALMFIVIFWLYCNNHSGTDLSDMTLHLECDLIEMLNFNKDIEFLIKQSLIESELCRHGSSKMKALNYSYSIPETLLDAILLNNEMPDCKCKEALDVYDFVNQISTLIDIRRQDEGNTGELFMNVEKLEDENNHLDMIQTIKGFKLDIEERTLWYEMCDDLICSGNTSVDSTMSDIYKNIRKRLQKSREIIEKTNKLFELDLIELESSGFFSDACISLSEKGKEMFLTDDLILFQKKDKAKQLISPDSIKEKRLFFDEKLQSEMSFITQSFEDNNFVNLQSRLTDKGLPKGLAAIFYGAPGTGKTESVYQLAKTTGRAILHVDISQSKSMWFGESEKKIKEIFTNYEKLSKTSDVKPILLFNEADAIFGKRKDSTMSNVAQTENAIQNIILEEMEKLNGILIATTNLNQNLDAAFERRFLFKIKFDKPSIQAKQKIWQSKLDWLGDKDALLLATEYSFSGGEIDNIVRKATMEEVLTGNKSTIQQVQVYCDTEKFISTNGCQRIGFQ
jgi:SpoVK/Ycf46/Vps4 family AAA+-type ATPase